MSEIKGRIQLGVRMVVLSCGLMMTGLAAADGLRITDVQVGPNDGGIAKVTFNLAWFNSWRHDSFHDAAWVFFKTRAGTSGWRHAALSAGRILNPEGYAAGNGTALEFVVPEDGVGMFVRRAGNGIGDVSAQGVTAVISHKAEAGAPEIRAFGVEMVYLPEGPFFVGLGAEEPYPSGGYGFGGMEQNWLYRYARSDGRDFLSTFNYSRVGYVDAWVMTSPDERIPAYQVKDAGPIPTGREQGSLWAVAIKPEDKSEVPAAFPNGYAAFYSMKFPWITQGQYADFLNTLPPAQAKPRYWLEGHGVAASGGGSAVRRQGQAPDYTYAATDPDARCPWVSWKDAVVYAAWSGLRPMTELEFEKVVRGPEFAVPNDASPSYWGVNGVQALRVFERTISIGDAVGRAFKGSHGRGTLEPPADWPVTHLEGVILRGDALPETWRPDGFVPTHLLIAGRTFPLYADADQSNERYPGWRGARSAPAPAGTAIPGQMAADTAMLPFKRPEAQTYKLARMQQRMNPDGALGEWQQPTLTLAEPMWIQPSHMRFPSRDNTNAWRGAGDASAKVYLGWDGEALCVAAEVTDDVASNTNDVDSLWDGDAMNFGVIDADANHTDLWLALTGAGVVMSPLADPTEKLATIAKYAVVRDEATKVTRYEMRLPLTGLKLTIGRECCFYFRFFDNDGSGAHYRFDLAPLVTDPFKASLYSKFVLGE